MKFKRKAKMKDFKIILWSTIHLIIFEFICILLQFFSKIGLAPTVGSDGTGFLPLTEYKLNLFFTVTACILFLITFSIFYIKYFRNDVKKVFKLHWLFIILFILIYLLLGYIGFVLFLLITIFKVGLFSTVVNEPIILYILMTIYVTIFILTDIIKLIINFIKRRKK